MAPNRNGNRTLFLSLLILPAFVGCGGDMTAEEDAALAEADLAAIPQFPHRAVCADPGNGEARCHAMIRVDASGNAVSSMTTVSGLTPANLQSAYKVPAGSGHPLVAIVDAMDDPTAESDLAVYRKQFGLPACTTANGCFKKVNQSGKASPLPKADSGWAGEISLDLDMVSAACPSCYILLVEATSATMANLGTAVNTAVKLGAVAVSNSYGGGESSSDSSYDSKYFNHSGVLITVSSGDSGYGVQYPASSPYVTAVGGTSLTKSSASRGWAEKAWSGAGSGCSAYTSKPSYQKDAGCKKRTVTDVSAVADPNTGVAVYDTYSGAGGWNVYGGTSASSPLVAAIYAITGKAGSALGWAYAHTSAFYDVTSGNNGSCGTGSTKYLCTAVSGYDGPTGLGTPNGTAMKSAAK
jgi:subtilase family serine protease